MDKSSYDLLDGAVIQAVVLKEELIAMRSDKNRLNDNECFLRICNALDNVVDITLKLNIALRQ